MRTHLAYNRSLEDAAKNTSTRVSTLHAWAPALRPVQGVFIAIGGPQGHGDSLTVAETGNSLQTRARE